MCDEATDTADAGQLRMLKFLDVLIAEIKRRPILWDKKFKHENYGNRKKANEEWKSIASKLNKSVDELKAKWRNLKDTFHREEKKIQISFFEEGRPLISYYTGQWDKFEKLLFLYNTRIHTRSNEEYIEANEPQIRIENIKEEYDLSEHSNDPLLEEENTMLAPMNTDDNLGVKNNILTTGALGIDLNSDTDQNINDYEETRRKRTLDNRSNEIAKKKRTTEPLAIETDIDEEMLVQSLVPFLWRLNPIKKLIVRNELQNLLLKELLCDQCKISGLRPDCHCNYN